MALQTLNLAGKEFVVIERSEYERLAHANGIDDADLPPLPKSDAHGNVPAAAYGRALLARKLVMARRRARLTGRLKGT